MLTWKQRPKKSVGATGITNLRTFETRCGNYKIIETKYQGNLGDFPAHIQLWYKIRIDPCEKGGYKDVRWTWQVISKHRKITAAKRRAEQHAKNVKEITT